MSKRDIFQEAEFYKKFKANEITFPNDFTIRMGELIKKAREERGLSQAQLAKNLSRRQAAISDFETGKKDISVLEIIAIAHALGKPLSFFFPDHIVTGSIFEVQNRQEREVLNQFKFLEHVGGTDLAIQLLNFLGSYFYEQDQKAERGYEPDEMDEEE